MGSTPIQTKLKAQTESLIANPQTKSKTQIWLGQPKLKLLWFPMLVGPKLKNDYGVQNKAQFTYIVYDEIL